MSFRTIIVDDSAIYRKILSETVADFSEINLIGTASNADLALKKIGFSKPDLVFLDVHLPDMDGIAVLKEIRSKYPDTAVVMVSGISSKNTIDTITALEYGAVDFISKPDSPDMNRNIEQLKDDVRSILRLVTLRKLTKRKISGSVSSAPVIQEKPKIVKTELFPSSFSVCAIGVSTGGPEALNKLIPNLPENFAIPVLVVQHMPQLFTKSLSDSLDKKSKLRVIEGTDGTEIKKGFVYIAPGGKHMVVRNQDGKNIIGINDGPPENSCRPSVDVLFRSVADHYGDSGVLAVVLTGMGNDGCSGIRALKRKKCFCITQSEPTCVVYGMPRAVDEAGLSDKSVPIELIAAELQIQVLKQPHHI
jgi:two-component system chemotaxis response regulator CheB